MELIGHSGLIGNWTYNNLPASFHFDRGYTGHQMLDAFGLININMNGRVYDPLVARFLSPDKFVQDPQNSHSYNRYSYCFNNPLKFTDPSGMQSIYHGIYNPSQPASKGNSVNGPQLDIDGIRFSNSFSITSAFPSGGGGSGFSMIESVEYAGDLSGYGIRQEDLYSPRGVVYSGVDAWKIRSAHAFGTLQYNGASGMYGNYYLYQAAIVFSGKANRYIGATESYWHNDGVVSYYGANFIYFKAARGGVAASIGNSFKNDFDNGIAPLLSIATSMVENASDQVRNEIIQETRSLSSVTIANKNAWNSFSKISKYSGYAGKALGIYGAYNAGTALLNDPSNPANWIKFGASTGMLFMKANPYTFVIGVGYTVLDQGGYIDNWIGTTTNK